MSEGEDPPTLCRFQTHRKLVVQAARAQVPVQAPVLAREQVVVVVVVPAEAVVRGLALECGWEVREVVLESVLAEWC